MKTLKELLKEINDWQDSVFTKATPLSAATHLERETGELIKAIIGCLYEADRKHIAEEAADCFLLVAGVAHLSGIDLEQAVKEKMTINRERVWGEPDRDGVVEHVKGTLLEVFKNDPTPQQIDMLEEITYDAPIEVDYSPEMDTVRKIIFIREED